MIQSQFNKKLAIWKSIIIIFSITGLLACITVLFPQTRHKIMDLAIRFFHKQPFNYQSWFNALSSYFMGGICLILFFDYCTLTKSGKLLVHKAKKEMKDCLSEIDFRSFIKPVLLLSGIYLLGTLTIIRANISYKDDIWRSATGDSVWYSVNRYVSELCSIFVHGGTNITDISPLPQLLAILILSISSVLLVYVVCNRKITVIRLIASIPLGLSPFFLECISFKFDSPYMALSILASIIPFLLINRRKAFIFCSIVSLLVMCMTYQASAGVYLLVVIILSFQYLNRQEKTNKEILCFLGSAVFSYCIALLFFRFFLMKSESNVTFPVPHIISGFLINIKNYAMYINKDLGLIWKIGIVFVILFFILKSTYKSAKRKLFSFFVSILVICISFILSYGISSLLVVPDLTPRTFLGFGVFLAIMCVYVVSDYKKIATILVIALNWCFFVFAFSYGNALADQARYAEFRVGILLHDLSVIYPDTDGEVLSIQIENTIDFAPTIKNISKNYRVIERLMVRRLDVDIDWEFIYILDYYKYNHSRKINLPLATSIDFNYFNLPVVFNSYYHTIKSDGTHVLILLKH